MTPPFRDNRFDPYGCQDCADVDLEGFSDTSKEEAYSQEGSVTSWETGDSNESSAFDENDCRPGRSSRLTLMDLPVEIRLQIYSWLHLMTPVQHAQLAPWYPTPKHGACFLKAIRRTCGDGKGETSDLEEPEESEEAGVDESRLLSPWRPASSLPTALLSTNRQIYHEARVIPFHNNEFVFVNWFSSGLWGARGFTRNLAPWQRNEMRYARLEMHVTDLQGAGLKEWQALCDLWSHGLWGLRLKLAGTENRRRRHAVLETTAVSDPPSTTDEDEEDANKKEDTALKTLLCSGLSKLGALGRLEIELDRIRWSDGHKVKWAEDLENYLNRERMYGNTVQVVSVRRIKQ